MIRATSLSGAVVAYTVRATDPDTPSPEITVSCRPLSGTLFAGGPNGGTKKTKVTCVAHDPRGNNSPTDSFTVKIIGARDQLLTLAHEVATTHGASHRRRLLLLAFLTEAAKEVAAGAPGRAEIALRDFVTNTRALTDVRPKARAHLTSEGKRLAGVITRGRVASRSTAG